jgi:hypothetical protein
MYKHVLIPTDGSDTAGKAPASSSRARRAHASRGSPRCRNIAYLDKAR